MPPIVLNEVFASYDNDPFTVNTAAMTSTTARLNLYAELHNPFKTTPGGYTDTNDGGTAFLTVAGGTATAYPTYKILAYQSTPGLTSNLRDVIAVGNPVKNPTYNLGLPDAASFTPLNGAGASDWGGSTGTQQLLPANGAASTPLLAAGIASATEAGNTVTITTMAAHGFTTGQTAVIAGVGVAGYNGSFPITVTSPTMFTCNNSTGGLAAGMGGTATVGTNTGYYVLGPAATYLPSPIPTCRPRTRIRP